MGWMQRNGRILFLLGITFMILSVGAGAFAGGFGTTQTPDEEATPTPTAEATGTAEATPTPEVINRSYGAPPELMLEDGVDYRAVIHLASGSVEVDLLEAEAPEHVNNFVFLARNRFYEGLTFHRVIPGFTGETGPGSVTMAQTGDPLGTGTGGPGYLLNPASNELPFEAGAVGMAQSAQGVSGSQFFIVTGPAPHLNDTFTVFAQVTDGLELIEKLTPRDPQLANQPRGDVIERIEIIEE